MIIAQITDVHMALPGVRLFGDYDPGPALRRTLAALEALAERPDLIAFTGDLTESGSPEEYAALRAILDATDLPVAVIPGNHDERDAFAAAFADGRHRAGAGAFLHFVVDDTPLRLLFLDTLGVPGGSGGLLCHARLDWIAERLAEAPDREVVIFMHHPPFATGVSVMDAIGCENGDRLAELVAAHGRVLRVACGHVHRPVVAGFGGTIGSICPGVAYQLPLRFAPGGRFDMLPQPPAFQLHRWRAHTGLVTHTDHVRAAP